VIVNQWVPAAHRGDAVGDHARVVRDVLRRAGHDSDLFAIQIDEDLRDDVVPFGDASARNGDVTILHFAAASAMSEAFGTLPGRRVLHYHNVTPAHFVAPFDTGLAAMAVQGRRELAALASRADRGVGDSEFNRRELESLGFAMTSVLPIAVDTSRLVDAPPAPAIDDLLQDGLANILFVGRIAPNKRIEDHLRLAEHYKRYVDSGYRFVFVGRTDVVPSYYKAIHALMAEYRMLPERFLFTGAVPDAELAAYYRNAHAYVSLSEHEGFGVPLVEAMALDVPVVAYAAAAVPETLGGAGLLFAPKDLEHAAELLGAAIYEEPLRARVLAGQRRRVADFAPERFEARLGDLMKDLVNGAMV
jgi:glycosyltransferase involved in cell wall biosynthesis